MMKTDKGEKCANVTNNYNNIIKVMKNSNRRGAVKYMQQITTIRLTEVEENTKRYNNNIRVA